MTSELTTQELDEIDARHKAATPGPWGVYEFGGGTAIDIAADLTDTGTGYRARREICRLEDEPLDNDPAHREWTAEEDWAQVRADAEFIAHAPQDVRLLLAELRRQGALIAAVMAVHEKGEHNGLAICLHCASQMFPPPETGIWSESAYPCATLQALGATEDQAAASPAV
ncbi:hypothetical protein [Streptomyces caniscabiei]|uniref:Phage protein n=1 Tax=Streptomyces caniscabiei TaxID=2746961 RepID=A0ABU4MYH3_9ACTN|nr:hypothetical protein [Streptomyces caniscabiei]MBE4790265.1 hypothetical protein [Streptomyces caniscabiei]MBE4799506.1 hypothetical protein [Streptomyces caniscabiei]MDX3015122.1 hypothetical protein [Streptomyces caniscabiei]MDX3042565.1 hypothetical protein [Streptomyces caniscabiei]